MRRAVALLACVLVACTTRPATQIIVEVQAERGVRADLDVVHVVVNGGDGSTVGAPSIQRLDVRERPPRWPFTVVIAPLDRDPERRYEVVVTAEGEQPAVGERPLIARVRAISGFVPGETRILRLLLEDSCRGVSCDDDETCRAGRCRDAVVPTSDLEIDGDAGGRGDVGVQDVAVVGDGGVATDDAPQPSDAPACSFDPAADRDDWRAPAQNCGGLTPDSMSISIDPTTCVGAITAGMLCGGVPPVSASSADAYWHGTTTEPFSITWCGRMFSCTASLEPPYMRLHCGSCSFAFGTPP